MHELTKKMVAGEGMVDIDKMVVSWLEEKVLKISGISKEYLREVLGLTEPGTIEPISYKVDEKDEPRLYEVVTKLGQVIEAVNTLRKEGERG